MPPPSKLGEKIAHTLIRNRKLALSAFILIGLPTFFTAYTEFCRIRIIKQRKRKLQTQTKDNQGSKSESEFVDDLLALDDVEAVKNRYGSMVVAGRYSNPFTEWKEPCGMWDFFFWQLILRPLQGKFGWNGGINDDDYETHQALQASEPNWIKLFGSGYLRKLRKEIKDLSSSESSFEHLSDSEEDGIVRVDKDLTVTWIGQSTAYVQMESLCILTDPIFETKTVEAPLAPVRLVPPPCTISSFASLQIILISHNHLDHLHPNSIIQLKETSPGARYFVPLGVSAFLINLGISNELIVEMDWWQEWEGTVSVDALNGQEKRDIKVVCIPAMHWSGRNAFDSNQTLWCSFLLQGPTQSLFHCGDTGYTPHYKAVPKLYAPPTLSLLPIGSYLPRWHLQSVHLSPPEAIQLHKDLQSKYSVAVHWSTWVSLSDEDWHKPEHDLINAREEQSISEDAFKVIRIGETNVFAA